MSTRYNGTGTRHTRTATGYTTGGDFTLCTRVTWPSLLGAFSYFMGFNNAGSANYTMVGLNSSNQLHWSSNGSGVTPGTPFVPTAGTEYFVAMVRSGSSSILYWATIGAGSLSSQSGTADAMNTSWQYFLGADNAGEAVNVRLNSCKGWAAALTPTELLAERASFTPRRTANLVEFHPQHHGPDTADYSGNGRTLTAAGTLTLEANPTTLEWGEPGPAFIRDTAITKGVNGASVAITIPTNKVVGDLLFGFHAIDATASATDSGTASSGWVAVAASETQGSNVLRGRFYFKIATAGSDALTVTGPGQDYGMVVHAIANHGGANVADLIKTAQATNTTGNPDPPTTAALPSRRHLFLTFTNVDLSATGQGLTAVPSGYLPIVMDKSANSTSSNAFGVGARQIFTPATTAENPGTFTHNPTTRPWQAWTFVIPPFDLPQHSVHVVATPTLTDVQDAALAHFDTTDIDDFVDLIDPLGPGRTPDQFADWAWGKDFADAYLEVLIWLRVLTYIRLGSKHAAMSPTAPTYYLDYGGGDLYGTDLAEITAEAGRRYWVHSDFGISILNDVDLATNEYTAETLPQRNGMTSEFKNGEVTGYGDTIVADDLGGGWRTTSGPGGTVWVTPAEADTIYWPVDILAGPVGGSVMFWAVAWHVEYPTGGGLQGHELIDTRILNINVFGTVSGTAVFDFGSAAIYGFKFIKDGNYTYVLFREWSPSFGPGDHFDTLVDDVTYLHIGRIDTSGAQTVMNTDHTGDVFTYYEWWNGSGWSHTWTDTVRMKDNAAADIAGEACIAKLGTSNYVLVVGQYWEAATRVYKSTAITGPWTLVHTQPAPFGEEIVTDRKRTRVHMYAYTAADGFPIAADQVVAWSHMMQFESGASPAAWTRTGKHALLVDAPYAVVLPTTGPSLGSATTSHTWVPAAVGKRTPKGTGSATHDWVPAAVGDAPDVGTSEGTATTSHTWTPAATGSSVPDKGTATTAHTWVPAATGSGATRSGTATTSHTWVPLGSGKRTPKATGSATHTWAPTAVGDAPTVGMNDGTATTSHTWTPAATGAAVHRGTATTSHTHNPTATGKREPEGAATVSHTWTPAAVGDAPTIGMSEGAASTSHTHNPAATGQRAPKGTATTSHVWSPVATAAGHYFGTATTSHTWAPTATGLAGELVGPVITGDLGIAEVGEGRSMIETETGRSIQT